MCNCEWVQQTECYFADIILILSEILVNNTTNSIHDKVTEHSFTQAFISNKLDKNLNHLKDNIILNKEKSALLRSSRYNRLRTTEIDLLSILDTICVTTDEYSCHNIISNILIAHHVASRATEFRFPSVMSFRKKYPSIEKLYGDWSRDIY